MQQETVESFHAQSRQAVVHRPAQVASTGVVVLDPPARAVLRRRHDVGLADDLQVLAQPGGLAQGRTEVRLATPAGIDVGMVEASQPALDTAFDKAQQRLGFAQFGVFQQAHHAQQQRLGEHGRGHRRLRQKM